MKEGLPTLYWGFRLCWSAVHVIVLLALLGFFVWWALTAADGDETCWPSGSTIVPSGEMVTT